MGENNGGIPSYMNGPALGGFGVLADDVAVHAFLTFPWRPPRLVHVR